jgi:hypothetical protein
MTLTRRQFISTSAIAAGAVVMTPFGHAMASPVLPAAGTTATLTVRGDKLADALKALPAYKTGDPIRSVKVSKGKYKCSKPIYVPSGVYLDASGATLLFNMRGTDTALLRIENATDVTINGGTWDGYKAKEKKKTEWRHAIRVHSSKNVTLQNLKAQNAKGDGIYVGTDAVPSTGVLINRVNCTKNARAGLGITACDGLTVTNSNFYANYGHSPDCGAVIEPHDNSVIDNVKFSYCNFYSNGSRGFHIVMHKTSSLTPTTGIVLDHCTFKKNGGKSGKDKATAGLAMKAPRLVKVTNCTSSGNKWGVYIDRRDTPGVVGSVVLDACTVKGNLYDGMMVDSPIKSLQVLKSTITGNSKKKKSKYNGIRVKQAASVEVTGGSITKHPRGYGVRAEKGVTGVVLTGVTLSGNKKPQVYGSVSVK